MLFISSIQSDLFPSSFVKKRLKISSDTGNGEAKLYLNDDHSLDYYIQFFNNYDPSNIYLFLRASFESYLSNPSIIAEYASNPTTHRYKSVNDCYRVDKLSFILSTQPIAIPLNFEPRFELDPQNRYYIRSYDDVFREILRSIALPYTTSLRIDKYSYDGNFAPYNFLNLIIPQTTDLETNIYILSLT